MLELCSFLLYAVVSNVISIINILSTILFFYCGKIVHFGEENLGVKTYSHFTPVIHLCVLLFIVDTTGHLSLVFVSSHFPHLMPRQLTHQ